MITFVTQQVGECYSMSGLMGHDTSCGKYQQEAIMGTDAREREDAAVNLICLQITESA